ncbi:hypothetical protein [Rhizobium sp. AG855]|uniref:hypothetical protein n=1 Tax=Rhizobium sp. AG855 TaxID=2183898 RepID=UPI000E738D98|nr:hypothetical protein [Rhizobium sp. AG855]
MQQVLYHPPHVTAALDQLDGLSDAELRKFIAAGCTPDGLKMSGEVLVRLIRRARIDGERLTEHAAWKRLLADLKVWARKAYSTLAEEDREQIVGALLEKIASDVQKSRTIDFWEITFARKRDRAAADQYQEYYADRYRNGHVEYDTDVHGRSDDGSEVRDLMETTLIEGFASSVLSQEEMRYFQPLMLSDIPLCSPEASIDLVRALGKPEGTLREIKTKIKAKLKRALERTT